jgi:GMP reductase
MRIIEDPKLDFSDVLILPKRSTLTSRKEVSLEKTYTFKHSKYVWTGIPIIAANMDGVGTLTMAETLSEFKMLTALVKSYDLDDVRSPCKETLDWNYTMFSTGITDSNLSEMDRILDYHKTVKFICIDVANGYTEMFVEACRAFRQKYPDITIIAGNVVTPEMTEELILNGVDIVKVGIGPGSVCTTRLKTGVGYPQLSAIIECADAAHGLGGHIVADGGCTSPGDIAKAFGAGADFVMIGGMLAGHDQGQGKIIEEVYELDKLRENSYANEIDIRKFVEFYGMSSQDAQEAHGGFKDYRASEGKTVRVPYRGNVVKTVKDILGGIRSTCTYVGATSLKQLPKRTTFVRVSRQLNNIFS